MIALEKSHQNLSDYNQFLFKNRFEVNKKSIFLVKKCEIKIYEYTQLIIYNLFIIN